MARKIFSADFKAKVALEAMKDQLTLAELAKKYDVHPSQIKDWKCTLASQAEGLFSKKDNGTSQVKNEKYIEALERKAGQQVLEIDFLKKNLNSYPKPNV
jgi:transposase